MAGIGAQQAFSHGARRVSNAPITDFFHTRNAEDELGKIGTLPPSIQRIYRVSGRKPRECRWGGRGVLTASRSNISTSGFGMALRTRPEPLRFPPHLEHRRPTSGVKASSSSSNAGWLQSTQLIENTRPAI